MPRGRPPKPTEAKRKAGNPGKRKLPDNVQVGGRGIPTPRKGMSAKVQTVWREIVALIDPDVLDKADAIMLEALCMAVLAMREAEKQLVKTGKDGGFLVTQPSGRVARHPAFDVFTHSASTVRQLSEHFGMSPSARARLGVSGEKGKRPETDPDIGPSPRLRKIDGGRK